MRAAAPPPANPLPTPRIEPRVVSGANGHPDVRVTVIGARPAAPRRPTVLHIHGGGFLVGRPQDTYAASQRLAEALDCVVVEAEYRLSPETRFPGLLEDCYTALLWLHAQADALGVDRARIAVMDESAGGGLAAMLAIAARDRRRLPLWCLILIYPMLDDRTGSTRAVPPFIGTISWNAQANRFGGSALLGEPASGARVPPGSVPARAPALQGLPPTFVGVGVGAIDLFVDKDIAYAQRLTAAGVPVRLQVVPGAYHGVDFIAPASQAACNFADGWQRVLRTAFTTAWTTPAAKQLRACAADDTHCAIDYKIEC